MAERVGSDITRYHMLPIPAKVIFIVGTICGIGVAIVWIFGLIVFNRVMFEVGYYYLLYSIFVPAGLLLMPARKEDRDKPVPWYDWVAAALMFGLSMYFFFKSEAINILVWVPPSPFHFALAMVYCLLALEGGRRMAGKVYLVFFLIIGSYPLYAGHMPGLLFGMQFPLPDVIGMTVFGGQGMVGMIGKLLWSMIVGFLVFAGALIATGGGQFFLDLAGALLGRYRGGPAKVAVLSSAAFGSLSGSPMANIAATGSVTIPTMKRLGYPAHYAGAIEACASTGGAYMPPVMGALAFFMAMILNVEYRVIIIAAIIPSLLYYFGLLLQVDFYAARVKLKGLPPEEIPSLWPVLKKGWPFLAILLFLVWGLLYMRWEFMTPFYASALLVVLSFTSKETMLTPKRFVSAIVAIGKLVAQITILIFPAGLLISALIQTGVSHSVTAAMLVLGGENIYLILLIGVAACYLMGMVGMMTAAYLLLAITMGPGLAAVGGLNQIAVHMLLIYYTGLAIITPPIAGGAFLAATIAQAPPMKTAVTSMRLGIVLYFIPLFFVFNPALILQGPILESIYLFLLCLVGILFIAGGLESYLPKIGKLRGWARLPLIVAGFLIGFPEWTTTFIGGALALLVIFVSLKTRKRG